MAWCACILRSLGWPAKVLTNNDLRATRDITLSLQAVTLHTNLGDVKLEVYCEEVPRTAENFLALCASGCYNGTVFHRNIRGFMIQGGDPTGAPGLP